MTVKNKGGRPRIQITDEMIRQIEALAGYGLSQEEIASVIGVTPSTFSRRKTDTARVLQAIKDGKARASALVGKSLFDAAKAGNMTALIWWEKTRMGRYEKQGLEVTGAEGGALQVAVTRKFVHMTEPAKPTNRLQPTNTNGNGRARH